MPRSGLILAALLLGGPVAVRAAPIGIVAAENFYGDVARQVAGPDATVSSILSNPDQDPHLFEAGTAAARAVYRAAIVVYSGVGYDPWMDKLLGASARPERQVIVVGDLLHRAAGSNPHIWYDPAAMPAYAVALTAALTTADPAHAQAYRDRLQQFRASLTPLDAQITLLRGKYAGTPVTATEPVFGPMAAALGLAMRNEGFQRSVMNDTEPSASDIAAFETDLRQHRVKLLLYNSQATSGAAQRLLRIAREAGVPVVGVTETEPAGLDYQHWMLGQLAAMDKALSP